MKDTQRSPLDNAVKKTMQAVAKEVMQVGAENEDRLSVLKKHLGKVVSLKISEIESEENVRKGALANGDEFEKLKASIAQFGLLQPIIVELRATDSSYRLVCLAGHRRLAALKVLEHERVQCLLLAFEEKSQRTGAALSENLTREQLHFLDTAEGYLELLEQGWHEEQLARHFERDEKTIKRFLVMARWPEEAKTLVRAHPEKFSLRKLMHRFVQRSLGSSEALMAALRAEVEGRASEDSAKKRVGAVAASKPDAKVLRRNLENYFRTRPDVTVESRKLIEDALRFLKLL